VTVTCGPKTDHVFDFFLDISKPCLVFCSICDNRCRMFKSALFTLFFPLIFLPTSFAAVQKGKSRVPNPCPTGEHWVTAHAQSAYTRADGTPVSGSNHKAGCQKNPASYAVWNDRLKIGMPPKWEFKNEKSKVWTEDEKEKVLEALAALPPLLVNEIVSGIYRIKTSVQLPENPAANFQNQIALYDKAFENRQNVARVLGHEFSHTFYQGLTFPEQFDYAKTAEWEGKLGTSLKDTELTLSRSGIVEEDSQNNPEEDFANNIEYFVFNPKTLKEKSPQVYNWISKKFGDKLKLRSVK
jgi:hypothetical protein